MSEINEDEKYGEKYQYWQPRISAWTLVLPEHLNHYGYLFGGYLLHWADEYTYITANLDFPGHRQHRRERKKEGGTG